MIKKFAKYLYKTQWFGATMHECGWEEEPEGFKQKRYKEAKKILKFLGIKPTD